MHSALKSHPLRIQHSIAVAAAAIRLADHLDRQDGEELVAAAYLHDIGHSPSLAMTGHHGLNGARHLQGQFPERIVALVAHHSESRWEAHLRGLTGELAEYPREASVVADALTYCDMTTGPTGEAMTLTDRLAEIQRRYGRETLTNRSVELSRPCLEAAITRFRQAFPEAPDLSVVQRNAADSPPAR